MERFFDHLNDDICGWMELLNGVLVLLYARSG